MSSFLSQTTSPQEESYLNQFLSAEIKAGSFTHQAHLHVCWLLLKKYPLLKALKLLTEGLKQLVAKFGAEDKYHETLSVAMGLLVYERMKKGNPDFESFITQNQDLLKDWKAILKEFYSDKYLWSEEAKMRFVLGDIGEPHT